MTGGPQLSLFAAPTPRRVRFDPSDAFGDGRVREQYVAPSRPVRRQRSTGRVTFAERVANMLRAHPNQWIDGRAIQAIGGFYSWRTRCSDCRRPPYNMRVDNRQRTVQGEAGPFVVSEYMYVPDAPTSGAA